MAPDNVGGFSSGGVQVVSQRLYLESSSGTPTPTLVYYLAGGFKYGDNTITCSTGGVFGDMYLNPTDNSLFISNGYEFSIGMTLYSSSDGDPYYRVTSGRLRGSGKLFTTDGSGVITGLVTNC
jgi:hypothetical protein